MIVTYTEAERLEADALEREYQEALDLSDARLSKLRTDPPPSPEDYFAGISRKENPDAWEKQNRLFIKAMLAWNDAGSDEWREENKNQTRLMEDHSKKRAALFRRAEKRQFKELGTDPAVIVQDGKRQARMLIEAMRDEYLDTQEKIAHDGFLQGIPEGQKAGSFGAMNVVSLGDGAWALHEEEMNIQIHNALHLYFNHLKKFPPLLSELEDAVTAALQAADYVTTETEGLGKTVVVKSSSKPPQNRSPFDLIEKFSKLENTVTISNYPSALDFPVDKLTNLIFKGSFTDYRGQLKREKDGNDRITTAYSIDFADLDNVKVLRKLDYIDLIIHNSILSWYKNGINLLTDQMIYRMMNGNTDLEITPGWRKEIRRRTDKLMTTLVNITTYGQGNDPNKERKWTGNMIYALRENDAVINGVKTDCVRVLGMPVLAAHAGEDGHITSIPLHFLNTGINKNADAVALQTFLLQRVLQMSRNPKLSKTILYDTATDEIGRPEAETPAHARVRKSRQRDYIKRILDHWTAQGFIGGYQEQKKGKAFTGVTIIPPITTDTPPKTVTYPP